MVDARWFRLCTRRGAPLHSAGKKEWFFRVGSVCGGREMPFDDSARRSEGWRAMRRTRHDGKAVRTIPRREQGARALWEATSRHAMGLWSSLRRARGVGAHAQLANLACNPTNALLSVPAGEQTSRSASPRTTPSPTTAKPASSRSSAGQNRRSSGCEGRGWDSMISGRSRSSAREPSERCVGASLDRGCRD